MPYPHLALSQFQDYLFEALPEAHLLPKLLYGLLTSPLLAIDFPPRPSTSKDGPLARLAHLLFPTSPQPRAPFSAIVFDAFAGSCTRLSDDRAAAVALLTCTPPDDVARAIYPLLLSFESVDR